MKGIILAAGRGVRLNGATLQPKCLVEVGGITLLERQILALEAANIKEIVIVVGYESASIREACPRGIDFVENADYANTSSLYSLWLAREHLVDGFVVLNSDVLFHPRLLHELLRFPGENALLLSYRELGSEPLGEEEMKVTVNDGLVTDLSKQLDGAEADGENVGIVKFGAAGAKLLINYLDELIAVGAALDWAPRAFREFALHHPLHAVSTQGYPWIEIDFPEDYYKAVVEIYPRISASAGATDPALTTLPNL
jgi:choline kinase